MHIQITETMFKDAFKSANRAENFSHEGLTLLFEHFEQLEEDLGEPIELDVIAICCDYVELNMEWIDHDYQKSFESFNEAVEWLMEQTTVVGVTNNDTVVFQVF